MAANPLYGFSLYKSPTVSSNEEYLLIGANSQAFTAGDPISVNGSGFGVVNVGPGSAIFGIAAKTVTMASNNQTSAKVQVPMIPADQDYTFLVGTTADIGQTSVGSFYGIQNTVPPTGQFLIETTTAAINGAASAVVVLVQADPLADGGNGAGSGARKGLFRIVKSTDKNQLATG